jgi:hypothetical protein
VAATSRLGPEATAAILSADAPLLRRVLRRGDVQVDVRGSGGSGLLRARAMLEVGRRTVVLGSLETAAKRGGREGLRVHLRPGARRLLERALSSGRRPQVMLRTRAATGARPRQQVVIRVPPADWAAHR